MKAINQTAKNILDILTDGLTPDGETMSRIINNAPDTFMSVHVENVTALYGVESDSVAHYGEQDGDAMRDPEMIFWKGCDGNYYPFYFRNDYIGQERVAAWFEDGHMMKFAPREQADQASFAGTWMRNIQQQQGLTLPKAPRVNKRVNLLATLAKCSEEEMIRRINNDRILMREARQRRLAREAQAA